MSRRTAPLDDRSVRSWPSSLGRSSRNGSPPARASVIHKREMGLNPTTATPTTSPLRTCRREMSYRMITSSPPRPSRRSPESNASLLRWVPRRTDSTPQSRLKLSWVQREVNDSSIFSLQTEWISHRVGFVGRKGDRLLFCGRFVRPPTRPERRLPAERFSVFFRPVPFSAPDPGHDPEVKSNRVFLQPR